MTVSTVNAAAPAPAGTLATKIDYARLLAASGMLPAQYRDKPANLLWALEYAESLGLHPMAAITGVHVIEGKPSASAALIASLVRRAGHRLRVVGDDRQAVCEIVRADDPTFTFRSTWTIDRARTAGLLGKGTWSKYPAAMLKARAITECARDAAEDVLHGLHYTPEELGAVVDDAGAVRREVEAPAPVVEHLVEETRARRDRTGEPVAPADVEAVAADEAADVVGAEWLARVEASTDLEDLRDLYRAAGGLEDPPREAVRAAILARRDALLNPPATEEQAEAAEALEAGAEVTVDPSGVTVEDPDYFEGTVDADPDTLEPGDWPAVAPVPAPEGMTDAQTAVDAAAFLEESDPSDAGVSPKGRGRRPAGAGRDAFAKAKADLEAKAAAKAAEEGDA